MSWKEYIASPISVKKNNLVKSHSVIDQKEDNKVEAFLSKSMSLSQNKNFILDEKPIFQSKNSSIKREVDIELSNKQKQKLSCNLDWDVQSSSHGEDEKEMSFSGSQMNLIKNRISEIPDEKSLNNSKSHNSESQLWKIKETLQGIPKKSKIDLDNAQKCSDIAWNTEQPVWVDIEAQSYHEENIDKYIQTDERPIIHWLMETVKFAKINQITQTDDDIKVEKESQTFQSEWVDQDSQTSQGPIAYRQYQLSLNENFTMPSYRENNSSDAKQKAAAMQMCDQRPTESDKYVYDHDYEFGIWNEGNTCFLNAALQLVFSATEFIEYYHQKKYLPTDQDEENKVQMKSEGYQFCNAMHEICQDIVENK